MGLDDSGVKKRPSRHSEESQELWYRVDEYRKRNKELETSLKNMEAKFENEQAGKQHYKTGCSLIFNHTVRPYADFLGVELSGKLDEHFVSVSRDLVSKATESFTLRSKAQEQDTQLHNAQEQLRILKAEMLARVDNVTTISDIHFAQEFHSLGSYVRVLSRSIRTSGGKSISDVLKPRGFLVGVPGHHWEARAMKKVYIEAWIWSVLVDKVFGTPLLIFGNSSNIHKESWSMMFGKDHFGSWPCPCSSSEIWRYMTTERLLELSNRDMIINGYVQPEDMDMENPTWYRLVSDVFQQRINVANILEDHLTALCATADPMQVPKIVNKAFSLALDMLLSRSRVQITYPQIGVQFDEEAMSVRDTDEESLDNRTVAFVVRPGMTKWGDSHGKHFEESLNIVPCEVQLEVGSSNGASLDPMDFRTT
jgi:molecular chaperone GrpE (heat shock protein)